MISPQPMPLAMVPSYSQIMASRPQSQILTGSQNPFWNMAGQTSVSQTATDAQALNQNLQASTMPASVHGAGADQVSQFVLGLVLLVLLLMHQ